MTIESRVRAVLQKSLLVSDDKLAPGANLVDDLGLTSLDRFEVVMGIEEEFGIEMTGEEQETIKTVNDLVVYVASHSKSQDEQIA
jgi:acyl carrier protein